MSCELDSLRFLKLIFGSDVLLAIDASKGLVSLNAFVSLPETISCPQN